MSPEDIERMLKALSEKDLRIQCRARGLSPAGSKETLRDRVKEHMLTTRDTRMFNEDGSVAKVSNVIAGQSTEDMACGGAQNNYHRPGGQNVGNFLTDRSSSRVLAPPGGHSQIHFG